MIGSDYIRHFVIERSSEKNLELNEQQINLIVEIINDFLQRYETMRNL